MMMSLSQGPYGLILILQMLIHSVPQLTGEGDILVKTIHQVHLTKHGLSIVENVPTNLSLLLTVSLALQMPHLKVQHALQSLRLLTAVSSSLWTVLLNVGEGVQARDPIVITVDSPVAKCLHSSALPVILQQYFHRWYICSH